MTPNVFDKGMLDRIEGAEVRFAAGQCIFREGDAGKTMYLVRRGEVSIETNGQPLARLWPGDVFGEMSMIDDSARSATATAASDVHAIVIDRARFLSIIRDTPEFALFLLNVLSMRVRELNALI